MHMTAQDKDLVPAGPASVSQVGGCELPGVGSISDSLSLNPSMRATEAATGQIYI